MTTRPPHLSFAVALASLVWGSGCLSASDLGAPDDAPGELPPITAGTGDGVVHPRPAPPSARPPNGQSPIPGDDEGSNANPPVPPIEPGPPPAPVAPGADPFEFRCTPAAEPSVSPLKRLSKTEYANTIRDLLGFFFEAGEHATIMRGLDAALDGVPADARHGFDTEDASIAQPHLDAYFSVARGVSDVLNARWRLRTLAGQCAVRRNVNTTCVTAFIEGFGRLVFRRPLSQAEIDRYLGYYRVDEETGFRTIVFALLMSKEFIYRLELDGAPVDGRDDLQRVNAYELATRLSYHFWGSMPDAELFAAAALPSDDEDALTHDAGYRRQVDRLFDGADPEKTRAMTARFFRQWLALDEVALPHSDATDDPAALRDAMVDEIEALTDHYTWNVDGGYADLLLSDISFARGALADVYGVEPWSGDPRAPVALPPGERAGLLTRGAFLSTGGLRQNAMLRGAHVYRSVLCRNITIPSPDDVDGAIEPPEWTASESTRSLYEQTTEQGSCAGCHAVLNPLGFAFENYDAVGRFQTEEHLSDLSGDFVHPVDATTQQSLYAGDETVTHNGVELSEHIVESGPGAACMVRSYFRFAYGRAEDDAADGCVLEDLRQRLDGDGGSMASMFRGAALQPEFTLRKQ